MNSGVHTCNGAPLQIWRLARMGVWRLGGSGSKLGVLREAAEDRFL